MVYYHYLLLAKPKQKLDLERFPGMQSIELTPEPGRIELRRASKHVNISVTAAYSNTSGKPPTFV